MSRIPYVGIMETKQKHLTLVEKNKLLKFKLIKITRAFAYKVIIGKMHAVDIIKNKDAV